ncbi:hypothetical protein IFR04_000270 [Cadophora malorum]|uniref:Uncharacterized protein n=1 Tax=Cadophora malorum TaxID=108018 RepID=A0A8H7WL21_9HELO|nr:hypothetical protein IFR04_000270 [Cadophora malorum]
MRSFFAVNIGLFTTLPIIIFILAAIAELTLCVSALQAETYKLTGVMVIVFQSTLTVACPAGHTNYYTMHIADMDKVVDFWNLIAWDYAGP